MLSLKVGDIVQYKKNYGDGVVKSISGNFAVVQFAKFNNQTSTISIDDLTLIKGNKIVDTKTIKVGSKVIHNKFGQGRVVFLEDNIAHVRFSDKVRVILVERLTIDLSGEVVTEETNETQSSFKIMPFDYSNQATFSTEAKETLTFLRKNVKEGFATIQSYKGEKTESIGFVVDRRNCAIVYKIFGYNTDQFLMLMPYLSKLLSEFKESMKNRLKVSSELYCKETGFKFDIKIAFIFPNINIKDIDVNSIDKQIINDVFFKNFESINYGQIFNIDRNIVISESQTNALLERVIPEYSTVVLVPQTIENNDDVRFEKITGTEKSFKALALDDEQIASINNTRPGHYLTLANPGTGKSVLLLSKAYRLVSLNTEAKVLITCYNTNLKEHHRIFSEHSGLKAKNIHVDSFFSFILKYLDSLGLLPTYINLLGNNDDKFNSALKVFNDRVDSGDIKPVFDAIFIDEVQLFTPEMIYACKSLLKNGEKSYFELFGDINQDVRNANKRNGAPWKNEMLGLSWAGRTFYLKKNYRNTQQINTYIRNMIFELNRTLDGFNVRVKENDDVVPSPSDKKGRQKVNIFDISSSSNIAKTVLAIISFVRDKTHADYNDIAIITPVTSLKSIYYYPISQIKSLLDDKGIPNCNIYGEGKTNLMNSNGVIISTIDSSLGLDFKYVIMVGLHYFDFFWSASGVINPLKKSSFSTFMKTEAIESFKTIGRKIYSACSRARDGLYIVDDLSSSSPVRKLLYPDGGKEVYEVKKL